MVKITILGSCRFEPYEILAMPNKLDAELYERDHEGAYDDAFEKVFKKAIDESDVIFVYAPDGIGEHTDRDIQYAIQKGKPIVIYGDMRVNETK